MTHLRWLAIATLGINLPLLADTIYQSTAQGKQTVIQRDAILVKDDPNYVIYKHFDLKERRVIKVGLNKGSLPYHVVKSATRSASRLSTTGSVLATR